MTKQEQANKDLEALNKLERKAFIKSSDFKLKVWEMKIQLLIRKIINESN